jgi:hypothetical protein
MKAITVKLQFVRSTKNKHVYSEGEGAELIGSLYLGKSGLPNPAPAEIEVTIK